MKNNKSLTINSFEEMTDIFFKNLPERKENWGPIVFEYTIHFLHGFLFEPEYHFDKKSYDINNFTSILNNENYNFHQKSSLFKTIYYRTNIKDVFYYIDSLKKEDKETCVNFLSGSIELHLREDLLNSFSNNEELIKIFKEVLLLETKNNFTYIRRCSEILIPFKEKNPDCLLSKEIEKWEINSFIKNISFNEKYSKMIGWQIIKNYPYKNENNKKEFLLDLLEHVKSNQNDYKKHYPYAIFAYNFVIQLDSILCNVFNNSIPKLNSGFNLENINDVKQYTLRILNSNIKEDFKEEKLLSIIEKELIEHSIDSASFSKDTEDKVKKRI